VSQATANLKEAQGKPSGLRIETAYEAYFTLGDAAFEAKAPRCTEGNNVNAEAT